MYSLKFSVLSNEDDIARHFSLSGNNFSTDFSVGQGSFQVDVMFLSSSLQTFLENYHRTKGFIRAWRILIYNPVMEKNMVAEKGHRKKNLDSKKKKN